MDARVLTDRLYETGTLSREEFVWLIDHRDEKSAEHLFEKARIRAREHFGNRVYLRGLIECTSFCKNDCLYCGLRRSNRNCERYRLTGEQILERCRIGYELGFRTFVLQGGEDPYFTDERMCRIVSGIKEKYPDCAVTLSLGEKSRESFEALYRAGADRYLLRHEAADPGLYASLHPKELSLENRLRCLRDLKEIGYQVGAGMMLQAPGQTTEHVVTDLLFLKSLQPDMIGVGPFIPHKDTPFRDEKAGTAEYTLFLLGILRLMLPQVLLPATTALGTIDPHGREKGLLAGANVIMPNLSPAEVRGKYLLYDGKIISGDEAADSVNDMRYRIRSVGYEAVVSRGDAPRVISKAGGPAHGDL